MDTFQHKELISTALIGWGVGFAFGIFGLVAMGVLGGVAYLTAQHVHRQYEVIEVIEAEEETEQEPEEETKANG